MKSEMKEKAKAKEKYNGESNPDGLPQVKRQKNQKLKVVSQKYKVYCLKM